MPNMWIRLIHEQILTLTTILPSPNQVQTRPPETLRLEE
jgi:hypothetical protein